MEFTTEELAFIARVHAIEIQRKQAVLGEYDPALIRLMKDAVDARKLHEQGIAAQMDRDVLARAVEIKEILDRLPKASPPPPFVDHTLFNRSQDKLNAAVKAEVARQLQERDDDSGRTDD